MIDRYIAAVGDDKKDATTQAGQLRWWKKRIGGYSLADATPALILEHRDQLGSETTNHGAIRRLGHRDPDAGRIVWRLPCRRQKMAVDRIKPSVSVLKKEPSERKRFLLDDERDRLLVVCKDSRCELWEW